MGISWLGEDVVLREGDGCHVKKHGSAIQHRPPDGTLERRHREGRTRHRGVKKHIFVFEPSNSFLSNLFNSYATRGVK